MTLRHVSAVFTLVVIGVLVPMAYASPPDQTWLPGMYDNADHDDAVILVTSALGVMATVLTVEGTSTACVMATVVRPPGLPPPPESSPYRLRGPPSV